MDPNIVGNIFGTNDVDYSDTGFLDPDVRKRTVAGLSDTDVTAPDITAEAPSLGHLSHAGTLGPAPGDDINQGIKGALPLIASMGAQLAGGKQTVMGRTGEALAGGLQSMQLNSVMKKMLQQYLAGGGNAGNFPQDRSSGLPSDIEASGLSPEMLQHVYGTALTQRNTERKFPLEAMHTIAEVSNLMATGEYHTVQLPLLRMQAERALQDWMAFPANNAQEWQLRGVKIKEALAVIGKIEAETDRSQQTLQPDIEKTIQETQNLISEQNKREADRVKVMSEMDPRFKFIMASHEAAGKQHGAPQVHFNSYNGMASVYTAPNPITKYPGGWSDPFALPNAMYGGGNATSINLALKAAMGDFIGTAQKAFLGRYKGDKQEGVAAFQNLIETMTNPMTGEVNPSKMLDLLEGKEKLAFGSAFDVYNRRMPQVGMNQAMVEARDAADRAMHPASEERDNKEVGTKAPAPAPRAKPTPEDEKVTKIIQDSVAAASKWNVTNNPENFLKNGSFSLKALIKEMKTSFTKAKIKISDNQIKDFILKHQKEIENAIDSHRSQ